MALAHLTDLYARAQGRMLMQYRALIARFLPDLGVLIAEVQELEDAYWAFFQQLDVDTADGVWLDRLGGFIGEKRDGALTTPYREFIKARALANSSRGDWNRLLAIAHKVLDTAGAPSLLPRDWYPAAMSLDVTAIALGGQTGDVLLNRVVQLLQRARAIAVRFTVQYQDDANDANIFVCGDALGGTPTGKGFDSASAPNDPAAGRLAGSALA